MRNILFLLFLIPSLVFADGDRSVHIKINLHQKMDSIKSVYVELSDHLINFDSLSVPAYSKTILKKLKIQDSLEVYNNNLTSFLKINEYEEKKYKINSLYNNYKIAFSDIDSLDYVSHQYDSGYLIVNKISQNDSTWLNSLPITQTKLSSDLCDFYILQYDTTPITKLFIKELKKLAQQESKELGDNQEAIFKFIKNHEGEKLIVLVICTC